MSQDFLGIPGLRRDPSQHVVVVDPLASLLHAVGISPYWRLASEVAPNCGWVPGSLLLGHAWPYWAALFPGKDLHPVEEPLVGRLVERPDLSWRGFVATHQGRGFDFRVSYARARAEVENAFIDLLGCDPSPVETLPAKALCATPAFDAQFPGDVPPPRNRR